MLHCIVHVFHATPWASLQCLCSHCVTLSSVLHIMKMLQINIPICFTAECKRKLLERKEKSFFSFPTLWAKCYVWQKGKRWLVRWCLNQNMHDVVSVPTKWYPIVFTSVVFKWAHSSGIRMIIIVRKFEVSSDKTSYWKLMLIDIEQLSWCLWFESSAH